MVYGWLADLTMTVHFAFVCFVVVGGLLVLRRPAWGWVHLPSVLWGVSLEWAGWICPLTPLENWLRRQAGRSVYGEGFIEHYLLPVLYPEGLSRGLQVILGCLVMAINIVFYTAAWTRYRRVERS